MSQIQALPANPTDPISRPFPSIELGATCHHITYCLVPFLVVLFILAWIDHVNVGFTELSVLQDLQFSETVYGLDAGTFFTGYFLFEVPSNLLLEKIGTRKTLARITILWGLASMAMAYMRMPTSLYVMHSLPGIFEVGFFPGVALYLTYWFPSARHVRINDLFMTPSTVAGMVGDPIAGFIMSHMGGVGHLANWQWLSLFEDIPSVLIDFTVFAWLLGTPRQAKWLSAVEQDAVVRAVEAESRDPARHASLGAAFANVRVQVCVAIYFCVVSGNATITFWTPSIIKGLGVQGNFQIGLIAAIPFIAGTVTMVRNGAYSGRTGECRMYCAIAAVTAAAGLVTAGAPLGSSAPALISLTVAAVGILAAFPVFRSIPAAFLIGTAAAGGIVLINSIGNLAGFVAPHMVGWLKTSTGHLLAGLYLVVALELSVVVLVILGTHKH